MMLMIVYEDSLNGDAWERFLSNLKGKGENLPEVEAIQSPPEVPEAPVSSIGKQKATWQRPASLDSPYCHDCRHCRGYHISHLETLFETCPGQKSFSGEDGLSSA